jgi:hypothetical protein
MEIKTTINESIQDLLPWHTPEVKRLSVSLDTANAPGSDADGGILSTTTPPPVP